MKPMITRLIQQKYPATTIAPDNGHHQTFKKNTSAKDNGHHQTHDENQTMRMVHEIEERPCILFLRKGDIAPSLHQ
jgi:hypothetical protein